MELSEFQIDWDRERRTGVPEAILCEAKTGTQIDAIIAASAGRRLLLTRLSASVHRELAPETRGLLDYDPLSGTAVLGEPIALVDSGIGIVAAGTSDLPVAREAARTLAFTGHRAEIIADVGVAGLWRLMDRLDALRQCRSADRGGRHGGRAVQGAGRSRQSAGHRGADICRLWRRERRQGCTPRRAGELRTRSCRGEHR